MTLAEMQPVVQDSVITEQVQIQIKYAGYIDRQQAEIAKQIRYESLALPDDMAYDKVTGLSNEVRQLLQKQRPQTLGIASRLPGMTPAAVSILLIHLKR